MASIVTEPCIKCKYTNCVMVCPVEAFREDKEMLVIDPEVCIDCGACIPECPVQAIYMQDEVPAKWKNFIALNAEKAKVLPVITDKKKPLAEK
ncbi:MAG: 4Fe-4S dicluster domain-containing protein [Candidatus Omnitrophota bacterium]